jgi:protocatechuate 3,4-dioxygenase beta subunit
MLKIGLSTCFLIMLSCQMISISGRSQSKPATAGTATVSGRVVINGEPVRGVAVALQPEQMMYPSNQTMSLRSNSDGNGRFLITGIKAGRYHLTALAAGLIQQNESDPWGRGQVLDIAEGENVENQDISLIRGGVIAGRVVDSQGRPVGEETVRLSLVDENGQRRRYYGRSNYYMFITDDRGLYRLYGLPEGRYLVSVGYAPRDISSYLPPAHSFYPMTFHPDATEESEAKIIEVTGGSEQTGIDIKVSAPKPAVDVFGRVVEADTGKPVAGATITYGPLDEESRRAGYFTTGSNKTDATGGFQLSRMLPGKYVFSASFDRWSDDYYSEIAEAEVGEGELRGIEIKLKRGCSIKGVVVIEGANDPALREKLKRFRLYTNTRSEQSFLPNSSYTYVNPDGTFHLRGIRPGKVDLSMGNSWDVMGFVKLRVENNGIPAPDGLELKPGEHLNNVRFIVGYGKAAIRGKVIISGGEWPDDFRMSVIAQRKGDSRSPGGSSQVDSRGRFLVKHLLPGEYELRLSIYNVSSNKEKNERIAKLYRTISNIGQTVNVGDTGETTASITIDLSQKEQKNEK